MSHHQHSNGSNNQKNLVRIAPTSTQQPAPFSSLSRLKSVSLGELLQMNFPLKEPLIDPWFYTGQSAMVWAEPGVGKTWFGLTLALMMAGAGSALGWNTPKPTRVLVIDGEMNTRDIKERVSLLIPKAVEGLDLEAARRNLCVIPRHLQNPEHGFLDIANKDDHNTLLSVIREKYRADVVLLDNFTTLSDGITDENSAAQMKPVCNFLLKLKQAGVASILVHHSGKTGEGYRGSSALATTFEVIIGLKKIAEAEANQTCAFEISWEKYREKRSDATQPLKVSLEHCLEFAEGVPSVIWSYQATEHHMEQKIIAALESLQFATQDSLAAHLGISKSSLSKHKSRMHATGVYSKQKFEGYLKAAQEEPTEEDPQEF